MVLGKLPVPGRPTIWITVGQGPTALAVGAGGGCLDIFTLIYPFSPLSPSLWETARYRLKYCLKPMAVILGSKYRVPKFYQDCSNDDLGLTVTYFMAVQYGKMLIHKIAWKVLKILASKLVIRFVIMST